MPDGSTIESERTDRKTVYSKINSQLDAENNNIERKNFFTLSFDSKKGNFSTPSIKPQTNFPIVIEREYQRDNFKKGLFCFKVWINEDCLISRGKFFLYLQQLSFLYFPCTYFI